MKTHGQLSKFPAGLIAFAGFFFLNTYLYADQELGLETPKATSNQAPFCDECQAKLAHSCAKIPVYSPCCPCNMIAIRADFLYWKADEDGLEYGTKVIANPLIGEASQAEMKVLDLDFEWDPGFRVGFGYLFGCLDSWELSLDWTRIRSHAHGHASAMGIESQVGNVDTIISPWVNLLFALRAGASQASAHWRAAYDTVDFNIGKSFCLSRSAVFSPYFGVRGAWIHQNYHASYRSNFLLAENAPIFQRDVSFTARNHFNGVGLRGGAGLEWNFCNCLSLFSDFSTNAIYGKFKVQMKNLHDQGLGEGGIPPMPLDFFASESFHRIRLNLEGAVGIGWQMSFACDQYRIAIRAAYEMSQWINQNELFYTFYFRGQDTISTIPVRSQGDLSFQGGRFSVEFSF